MFKFSREAMVALVLLVAAIPAVARWRAQADAKAPPAKAAREVKLDFDQTEAGKPPADFTASTAGGGAPGAWTVIEDKSAPSGGKALGQTTTDDTELRFPMCVYDKIAAKDVEVSVKFKTIAGQVDQAAGIMARWQDRDNYYLTRANALEGNVRLYKVEKGVRKQFAGQQIEVPAGKWQSLKLEVKDKHFKVFFNDKLLFEADDETFKQAGKTGLWTKADSVSNFDDLVIKSNDA